MLITCPNCEAGYEVPDHLLAGEGRRLRCKSCMEEWRAVLLSEPEPDSPEPNVTAAEPTVTPEPPEPNAAPPVADGGPARRHRLPWLAPAAAWAASLVILVSGGAATFHWRADITAAWPASERVLGRLPQEHNR